MNFFLFKTLFVFTILLGGTISAFSQIHCYNIDGYWGDSSRLSMRIYGNYNGFVLYKDHPSNYTFKFTIDTEHNPTKKEIKSRYKKNIWWEYTGTVEYYVSEQYPTIKDVLEKGIGPTFLNSKSSFPGNPVIKRTAKAIIRIAPYKKRPQTYNFVFDDVGYAINLENLYFGD